MSNTTATAQPLLQIDQLTISFAPHNPPVVQNFSLSLQAGEKFALVGESGSGKSVTAQSILRLLPACLSGKIYWQGEDLIAYSERQMRAIRGKQIAMIFQEPMSALNPLLTIGQQITEVLQQHEALSYPAAIARAAQLLERTGIHPAERGLRSYPHQLSGGQRQRAMIAMALACRPQLLIADEPTTALDVTIRSQIMALLDELHSEYGMAVLLITHDLNLVQHFAQRVGVMQHGNLLEVAPTAQLFSQPQHTYTRQLLDAQPTQLVRPLAENAPTLLRASAVSVGFPYRTSWFKQTYLNAVDQVSLELKRGETLGIVGESGSGKTTLALALLGLQKMRDGHSQFAGQDLAQIDTQAKRRLRAKLQVVFQDPFAALSPRMTIEQIVTEGLALHSPQLSLEARRQRVLATLAEVGLSADSLYRYPHEFSGGQRQRIAIARVIILQPDLIVLDEPTSALDVSVQKQVLELLTQLQRKYGTGYLFISHDLAVIRAMSHRIIVMQHGKVVESGTTEEIFSQPQQAYTQTLLKALSN